LCFRPDVGTPALLEDGASASKWVKLNVKVPKRLLEEIDELAEELEYTNRSEFIREVLRDTTEPILTPGAQEGVSEGYADVAAGRTMSTDEARERLGIDD
jgi:metal-responsive CopG/Arc/MetJ family transcriptional regulator